MPHVKAYGYDDYEFEVGSCLSVWRMQNIVNSFTHCVHRASVSGCIAEFGVFQAETIRELAKYLQYLGMNTPVYLFDTFTGLPQPTEGKEGPGGKGLYCCSMDSVIQNMSGLSNYVLMPGLFSEYLETFTETIAFAHIDPDLYQGVKDAVEICRRRMPSGGRIVIDDYETHWQGVTTACVESVLNSHEWNVLLNQPGQLIAEKI